MISTLLVSQDKTFFKGLETIFAKNSMTTEWIDSAEKALSVISEKKIDVFIIDENLSDMTGRQFIAKVIEKNPMIDCVIASPRSGKDFHETYEGYGVLLQFPAWPGDDDAQKLVDRLAHIQKLQPTK